MLDATVVRDGDKATVTLAELTRGEAWTLLLFSRLHPRADESDARAALANEIGNRFGARVKIFGVEASSDAPSGFPETALLDVLHIAHVRYGVVDAAFYVLRPDTYVAARGPLGLVAKLIEHLASIFT